MARLFHPLPADCSEERLRLHAAYEISLTVMGFLAALLFLIGSILFFFASLETLAIWCFVIGSLFFLAEPLVKLVREWHYLRMDNLEALARRGEE